jgi:uncharacterized protein (DUF697 family)
VGTLFLPGIGTVMGGVAGGLIGGIAGSRIGSMAVQGLRDDAPTVGTFSPGAVVSRWSAPLTW